MVDSPRGFITSVQRFSLHDGPGIRTTIAFKGCPLRCRWCGNPEDLRPHPELAFYADRCRNAGECFAICPEQALAPGTERVDRARCTHCGDCETVCPNGALRIVGREVSISEVVGEALQDSPFYEATGGGVTLAGGEPTAQMAFMGALARRLTSKGVKVGLQTSGTFAWADFAPLLDELTFIHYELKLADPDEHRRHTGLDNREILANARRLVERDAPVTFRIPIVPGYTDGEDNLRGLARFLKELGVDLVHILPFNGAGDIKSARVGWPIPYFPIPDRHTVAASSTEAFALLRAEGLAPIAT